MNAIKFLYAATIVTWLIHAVSRKRGRRCALQELAKAIEGTGQVKGASGFGSLRRRPLRSCGRTPRIAPLGLKPAIKHDWNRGTEAHH